LLDIFHREGKKLRGGKKKRRERGGSEKKQKGAQKCANRTLVYLASKGGKRHKKGSQEGREGNQEVKSWKRRKIQLEVNAVFPLTPWERKKRHSAARTLGGACGGLLGNSKRFPDTRKAKERL